MIRLSELCSLLLLFTVADIDIIAVGSDGLVGRPDDLAVICKLLHAVGTPAGNSRHGKNRCVQLKRKIKHVINKTGVKVYINADPLIHLALLRDDLRCQLFNQGIESEFLFQTLFHRQLFYEGFEDHGTGIGL